MKTDIHFWSYLAQFFLEWNIFRTKVVQNIKTRILSSVTFFFFRKSCRLWDNVEKYCTAGHATQYNTALAHCTLDTQGYKNTLRICNISFAIQQWLHERVSMLRYMHNVCQGALYVTTRLWATFLQPLIQWKSNNYYIFWVCVCSLNCPACNAHAPYCRLLPTPLYNTCINTAVHRQQQVLHAVCSLAGKFLQKQEHFKTREQSVPLEAQIPKMGLAFPPCHHVQTSAHMHSRRYPVVTVGNSLRRR
jgi:hypothetical protein